MRTPYYCCLYNVHVFTFWLIRGGLTEITIQSFESIQWRHDSTKPESTLSPLFSLLRHFDKAQRMERSQRSLDVARDDKKGLRMTWEKDREDFIWILFGSFGYYSYFCHRKTWVRLCTSFAFRRYKNLKPSNALIASLLWLCVRKRDFGGQICNCGNN